MLRQSEAHGTYRLQHRSKQRLNKGKETAKRRFSKGKININREELGKQSAKRRFKKSLQTITEELAKVNKQRREELI